MVLGRGRLLTQGHLKELKAEHQHVYEVRVKADEERFAQDLAAAGCRIEPEDDFLIVEVPPDRTQALIWEVARAAGHQLRYLRPRRSTLEEVFFKAVAEGSDGARLT
jgi:ABC-2 type transport system ATP-binding protein